MLRSSQDLTHFAIDATDGSIGRVTDLYFDDDAWVVRYLVVETGSWLDSRKVLISPIAIHDPNWLQRTLPVSITQQQVRNSPSVDTEKPVSRQEEVQYADHYAYPSYWGGAGLWGDSLYPRGTAFDDAGGAGDGVERAQRAREDLTYLEAERVRQRHDDPHLRSCHDIEGYTLHASDGEIGTVTGYLVDDETWAIGYLVVETGHWWAGHKVLIAPQWISGVQWLDRSVSVALTQAEVQAAPGYDKNIPWSRQMDTSLYQPDGKTG